MHVLIVLLKHGHIVCVYLVYYWIIFGISLYIIGHALGMSFCRSITRACASLCHMDQKMCDAVDARQEIDLRIGLSLSHTHIHVHVHCTCTQHTHTFSLSFSGCAFTRFQTMRLQKVFPTVLSDQMISYGPCQFPTLGFVVDRVSTDTIIYTSAHSVSTQATLELCTLIARG